MGLPQHKEEPLNLDAMGNAELLALAIKGDKAAADLLQSRIAVDDLAQQMQAAKAAARKSQFDEVRQRGAEARRKNADAMREDWRAHLVNYLRSLPSRYITRAELVREISGYCIQRRYKGRCGSSILSSTIKTWLTLDLEREIRNEALSKGPIR